MGNRIFFEAVEKDYYARHFNLYHSALPDREIHIIAQCSEPDEPRVRERYPYFLEIYFSVDDLCWTNLLAGFPFGAGKKGKQVLDDEISQCVLAQIHQPDFIEKVRRYLKFVQFHESSQGQD